MVSNLALVAVVSSYSTRIKTLFHELCNASVVGKTAAEAMIIREHIKGQTLAIFIEGLRQPMKTIIKAADVKPTRTRQKIVVLLKARRRENTINRPIPKQRSKRYPTREEEKRKKNPIVTSARFRVMT
ncbi:hypothetical protein QTP88_024024 [Uroleucon formosanum]